MRRPQLRHSQAAINFGLAGLLLVTSSPTDAAGVRDLVQVGWHDDFQADRGWRAEPWRAPRPDEKASVSFGSDGGCFELKTPQSMAAWTRTVNPIWLDAFPLLELEYTCSEDAPEGLATLVLADDSTGPVTPGALNPENPLASEGKATIVLPVNERRHVVDLRGVYPSDRIARITLRLAGETPAAITLRRLAFRDANAAEPVLAAAGPIPPPAAAAPTDPSAPMPSWQPIERLARDRGAAAGTGIMEAEALHVEGRWRTCELALCLAARVFGNEAPWYNSASMRARKEIASPHQFIVQLAYEDRVTESHFPWCVQEGSRRVGATPAWYTVPVDPTRTLVRFSLVDRMSYGQVFLFGAAVNTSSKRLHSPVQSATTVASLHHNDQPIERRATTFSLAGDRLSVQNTWVRLSLDLSNGLRIAELTLVQPDRSVVKADSSGALAEVQDEKGNPLPATLIAAEAKLVPDGLEAVVNWAVGDPTDRKNLQVTMRARETGPIEIHSTLRNNAESPWDTAVSSPALHQVTVSSDPDQAGYLVGMRNTLLGRGDMAIERDYGGPWPLPVVDLFDSRIGGGLGVIINDPQLLPKHLQFKQAGGKADLAIRFAPLRVAAGGTVELPKIVLLPHTGGWRHTFEHYREEARRIATPQRRLADTFYCRRDYPLGGTDYLFSVPKLAYTPDVLGEESTRAFGGLDMIDISGWAYQEQTGRVGDYLKNDLGGLQEIRRLAQRAHQEGRKVGLYFEGYLIDRRCELAEKALPAWQIIRKDGKPWWWSGEMEFFACPGVKAWQQELAGRIATVAKATGVDAVYVDQFGISTMGRACWSPDHGHPVPSNPLQDERDLLTAVREALAAESPGTAIYIEYVPVDGLMGLIDAAFDIGMSDRTPGQHPTKLPLYRYVFPELASFQMIGHGIRPVPFEADDLHRAVFHGLGLWLKGRGDSWFTQGVRDLAPRAHAMFAAHGEVFRSADCEPLIPTLQADVYASRFTAGAKTIYTIYNAGYSTVHGPLLGIPARGQVRLTDLLSPGTGTLEGNAENCVITGSVEPWSVAAYLVEEE